MSYKIQVGGGKCSLCQADGTNKSTCPLNKDIPIDKKNFIKHKLAKKYLKQDDPLLKLFKEQSDEDQKALSVPASVRAASPKASPVRAASPKASPVRAASPKASPVRAASPRASPVRAASPRASPVKYNFPYQRAPEYIDSPIRSLQRHITSGVKYQRAPEYVDSPRSRTESIKESYKYKGAPDYSESPMKASYKYQGPPHYSRSSRSRHQQPAEIKLSRTIKTPFGLIRRNNTLPPLAMVMDNKLNTAEDILSMIEIERVPLPKSSASPTWVGFGKYIGTCTPMPCPTLNVVLKISCQWNIGDLTLEETVEMLKTTVKDYKKAAIPDDVAAILARIILNNRSLMTESMIYKKIYDELTTDPYYDQYVNNLPYVAHANYTSTDWFSTPDTPLKKFLNDVHKLTKKLLLASYNIDDIRTWMNYFNPDTLHILVTERNVGQSNSNLTSKSPEFIQSHLFQCFVTLKLLHDHNIYHTDLHSGNAMIATYSAENDSDRRNPNFEYVVDDIHYLVKKEYGLFRLFDWDNMDTKPVTNTTGRHPDYLQYLHMSGGDKATPLQKYMPMGFFMLAGLHTPDIPETVEAEYPRYVTIEELLEDEYFDNIRSEPIRRRHRPILSHLDFMLILYNIPLPEVTDISAVIQYVCEYIKTGRLSEEDVKKLLFAIILLSVRYKRKPSWWSSEPGPEIEIDDELMDQVLVIYRTYNPENIAIAEALNIGRAFVTEMRDYWGR